MIIKCQKCKKVFIQNEEENTKCPHCNSKISENDDINSENINSDFSNDDLSKYNLPPWENLNIKSIKTRFLITWKQASTNPTHFFKDMPATDPKGVFIFALIVLSFGIIFDSIWHILILNVAGEEILAQYHKNPDIAKLGINLDLLFNIHFVKLFMAPAIATFIIYTIAGLSHIGLMMFCEQNKGYDTTFRVTVYAMAPAITLAIPLSITLEIILSITLEILLIIILNIKYNKDKMYKLESEIMLILMLIVNWK